MQDDRRELLQMCVSCIERHCRAICTTNEVQMAALVYARMIQWCAARLLTARAFATWPHRWLSPLQQVSALRGGTAAGLCEAAPAETAAAAVRTAAWVGKLCSATRR